MTKRRNRKYNKGLLYYGNALKNLEKSQNIDKKHKKSSCVNIMTYAKEVAYFRHFQ